MAERDPLHQQSSEGSGLAPYRQPVRYPLLPYEKQLINLLGISREEYEQFVAEVRASSKPIPAGTVTADAGLTVAIISLVIGLASTAASFLLAPKPRAADTRRRADGGTISLAGINGQNRFAPSFGFESQQDLATYGTAIPLVFTKQAAASEDAGAGLLISPQLVWSRILSRGSYQIIELQYIVGQGPMSLRADWPIGKFGNLFLGNNTIDPSSADDYAFYYRDGAGSDNRFEREHLLSGSLLEEIEPFRAPSKGGDASYAFCSTFTPSNQVRFGVYSPIPNATAYRLNWQVISVNNSEDVRLPEDRRDLSPLDIRKWISGTHFNAGQMLWEGMSGTGANYSRRTGVWYTNAGTVESIIAPAGEFKAKIYEGDIDTELLVVVGVGRQALELDYRYDTESSQGQEIRNTLENEHAAHDSLLQVGEQFIIGTGLWKVIRRQQLDGHSGYGTDGYWHLEKGATEAEADQKSVPLVATLRCIKKIGGFSSTGGAQPVVFGVPNQKVITGGDDPYLGISEDDGSTKVIRRSDEVGYNQDFVLDEAFFPICKADVAVIQNTRPCEVTEIGIRSQVWLRFNGLCNFATVPPAETLRRADDRGTQYQNGNMNTYGQRVSLFSLDVRLAGSDADTPWDPSGRTFAVVGDSPVDQYNYIRVYNPTGKPLEYRIRPRTSADAVYINGPEWRVVVLDASRNEPYEWPHGGAGTTLNYKVNGYESTIGSLWSSKETSGISVFRRTTRTTEPRGIALINYQYRAGTGGSGAPDVSEISRAWQFMIAYRYFEGASLETSPPFDTSTGDGLTKYNNADPNRYREGEFVPVTEAYRPSDPEKIYIEFKVVARRIAGRTGLFWVLDRAVVDATRSGSGHPLGSRFFKGLILGYVGATFEFQTPVLEAVFEVTRVREIDSEEVSSSKRIFENYTALAEVSHYGSLIQRSCDSAPEHEIVYVNESLEDTPVAKYPRCAMAGLRLRAGTQFRALDQFRMFVTQGLQVPTLPIDGSTGTLAASNLFTELANYLITNTETGAGELASGLIDDAQFRRCSKFLIANKLFFNDVITEPVNIRSYLGEIAPSMLCALVIRNGRFSIEPALPINETTGAISQNKVPITAMFTSGNILEGSFSVEYLAAEERKSFTAIVRWRQYAENELPQTRAYEAYYEDIPENQRPIEEFDLRWVTSEQHAIRAARYFLAIRRRITHTVKFKTTPLGSALVPGSYILVNTEFNPYTPVDNGIVLPDGKIISGTTLEPGTYLIFMWQRGKPAVEESTMVVTAGSEPGMVVTESPRDVLFAIRGTEPRKNCYMVESITLDEDGMVDVVASHFPLDAEGRSIIAREILQVDGATITGSSL